MTDDLIHDAHVLYILHVTFYFELLPFAGICAIYRMFYLVIYKSLYSTTYVFDVLLSLDWCVSFDSITI